MIPLENKVKENKDAFLAKVKTISTALQIDPSWLMGIMYHESGLNHRIQNSIGAVGLIQFMPDTAAYLGTNGPALKAMSNVAQLDYVYKYYKPAAGRFKSAYDLFAYSFMPLAVGKPDTWVFETSKLPASIIAKQNPGFDINKDGKITIAEYKAYLRKWFVANGIDPEKKSL